MEPVKILPPDTLDRAEALLAERQVRRPVVTLPFLVQEVLTWRTVAKGAPDFGPRGLKALAGEFRSAAFDIKPGQTPRWTLAQKQRAEDLFREVAVLVAEGPRLHLPAFPGEADRDSLLLAAWKHLDRHLAALTFGILGTGILAQDPLDPAFQAQARIREGMVQTVGTLFPLLEYLAGPMGHGMPPREIRLTLSALLDALAHSLEEAFDLGGTRGRWLARSGGWEHPAYPCRAWELQAALDTGGPR